MTGPGRSHRPRRPPRAGGRAPLVVAVVVVAVVAAAVVDRTDSERDATTVGRVTAAPAVPSAEALSVSWYCPGGNANEGGSAVESVLVANVGDEEASAVVTALAGEADDPEPERIDVPAGDQVEVELADVTEVEEQRLEEGLVAGPGVMVEGFGGQVVVEHAVTRADEIAVGPCARGASTEWFFAAGTTVRGTELWLSLFNPFGDDAILDLMFLTDSGVQTPEGAEALVVPRRSRVSIPVHELVQREAQVATVVRARTGRVVAEQSLASDGSEVAAGLGLSLGATAPARTWVFPSGEATADGTQTVSVANFTDAGTEVEVRVLVDDDPIDPQTVPIPTRSVAVVDTGELVPPGSNTVVEVRTVGNEPVVAETLATAAGESDVGLALDFGAPAPSRQWVFAAATGLDADAVVSVFNPGPEPVTVSLLAASENGVEASEGGDRLTLEVGEVGSFDPSDLGVGSGDVVVVEADGRVFASRLLVTETGRSLDPGVPAR